MGASRRGYVTFLLALQWSYLLLLPFIALPYAPYSAAPAISAERTLAQEAALVRAMRKSAFEAHAALEAAAAVGDAVAELAGSEAGRQAFSHLKRGAQEQAVRTLILVRWADISSQWESRTGYAARISCRPNPSPSGLPIPSGLQLSGGLSNCYSYIHYHNDNQRYSTWLDDGIQIELSDTWSGTRAETALRAGELSP